MVLTADRRLKFSQGVWHCVRDTLRRRSLVMYWSMRFRILVSKLIYLVRLLKMNDDDLGGCVVLPLCDDFDEFC